MKKQHTLIIIFVIAIVVISALSFYGGMRCAQNKRNLGFSQGPGQLNSQGIRMNNGMTSGEILAIDDNSVTLKMKESGSKIILLSDSTAISKMTDSSKTDLIVGTNVTVTGTTNSDGSITAKSIQIRSADNQEMPPLPGEEINSTPPSVK
ncbi:hypothetical protein JW977_01455 [Candidatus Falkowbacteria bacterium]|nr:hypothetical protein [Candidatus Falkowbacteria bacterium]